MLIEQVESKGLAHYSYLVGDGKTAVVIDPRRDIDVYIEKVRREGLRITQILETHRNEDYVVGSLELAARTGAEIWHADSQWNYRYGQGVEDGQTFTVGKLKLQAIHSPGHTPGSMSYLLYGSDGAPWIIFTGDTLFSGDVGRVDLLGEKHIEEMAHHLYDTLFGKLLFLEEGVIVCPAHGAGSVCGSAISDRTWTTIGLELGNNPKLRYQNRTDFVDEVSKTLERPPYFAQMEELNLTGASLLSELVPPYPLDVEEFSRKMNESIVLDTRMELGFSAAHVPGALSIWQAGVPGFAGWFLPHDVPILLVNEAGYPEKEIRYLYRLGYDRLIGYLSGGMFGWHKAGKKSSSVKTVTVEELCRNLDRDEQTHILDVRSAEELETEGRITGAQHIHITHLPHQLEKIEKEGSLYIFCGTGLRSMTAASFLQRQNWQNAIVVLGGIAGWSSLSCPISR